MQALLRKSRRECLLQHRFVDELRVELSHATRTDAMTELSLRMVADIGFDSTPVSLVIADFLAGGANRQHSSQGLYLGDSLLLPLLDDQHSNTKACEANDDNREGHSGVIPGDLAKREHSKEWIQNGKELF